jgi:UDP-N-acetylmuramyl pentapeptide phosphotransferase/UDP-N-acetylglucosamine-1-phosphate transferase
MIFARSASFLKTPVIDRKMLNLALSFASCFIATFLLVRYGGGSYWASALDHDLNGVQKNHVTPVPRVGGIAIACATGITFALGAVFEIDPPRETMLLLLSATPVLCGGVLEDLTKHVAPAVRLTLAFFSALAGVFFLHAVINRVDLPLIDRILLFLPIAVALTVLVVAGLTNAMNLIDGFNGLASGVAILIFASLGYVAHQVDDCMVLSVSLTMIGAILGFLVWNYPVASIFLGDGGAYFIGFVMAELAVLLIVRHHNISAWYAAVVTIYPTFETVFSICRRRFVRGRPASEPDGVHLHTLVFKRLVRNRVPFPSVRQCSRRNARTSPYLWILNAMGVIPATVFWHNPIVLSLSALLFILSYIWLYASIVHFKTPPWLITNLGTKVLSGTAEQTRH